MAIIWGRAEGGAISERQKEEVTVQKPLQCKKYKKYKKYRKYLDTYLGRPFPN